jgi:hypothetical protein
VELAANNFFPPIAFVFKKSIWERIGGYDESLPVLGDWDFNLRFLIEGNIGVIPRPLVNYHHRDTANPNGTYANSVIGGIHRHVEYGAVLRNKYARSTNPSHAVLSNVLNAGYFKTTFGIDLAH